MSVADVANGVVGLCRQGKNLEAIETHYADDIVSVEPVSMPNMPAEMKGIEAIKGKNKWWIENHEVHSGNVQGPYISDDGFVALFEFDVTAKASGQRIQMREVGVYTVKDGKVAREEFFYNMPGS